MNKAEIRYSGGDQQERKTTISGSGVSAAAMATFITALEGMTLRKVTKASYVEQTTFSPTFPDPVENTDEVTIVVCRDSDNKVHRYQFPRLADVHVEFITGVGDRVIAASLATLVGHVATLTGLTLTPIEGYLLKLK